MSDTRIGAPAAAPPRAGGFLGFLFEAVRPLRDRRLVLPVLVLTVLLTGINVVLVRNAPATEGAARLIFAAQLAGLVGVVVTAVAVLRIVNRSPRRAWIPDGAMWLYALTVLFGAALVAAFAWLFGGRTDLVAGLATGAGVSLITAPFAPWFAAIAVERPLTWRAGRWLRDFARWLPPLVFWSLVLVVPLGELHAALYRTLLRGAGDWFWPLALVDGPLSAVLALLGLALASAAYRRVARG